METKLKCLDPKCNSINIVKKGFTPSGTQRYLCNKCKKRFTLEKTEYVQTLEKIMKEKDVVNKLTFDGLPPVKECGPNCSCKESAIISNKHRHEKSKKYKLKSLVHEYLTNIELICECANRINTLLYDTPTVYDYTKYGPYLVLNDKKLTLGKLTNIIQATSLFYDIFSYKPVDHITNLINMIGDGDFELDDVSIVEEFCILQKQLEDGQTNFELVAGCQYLNKFNDTLTMYYQYLETINMKLMEFIDE